MGCMEYPRRYSSEYENMNILGRIGENRVAIWNKARLLFENRAVAFSTGAEPVKVCVVGSGPAGFYSADKVRVIFNMEGSSLLVLVNWFDVECRLPRGCQMDAILICWYECLFFCLSVYARDGHGLYTYRKHCLVRMD